MSFIYPRLIDIHRPKQQAVGTGANVATLKSYTGTTTDTISSTGENLVLTALPASVQFVSPLSRGAGSNLPTDTHAPGAWRIFIPSASAAITAILNRDIIVDDQGNRYQCEDSYWTFFGWHLRARLLEV